MMHRRIVTTLLGLVVLGSAPCVTQTLEAQTVVLVRHAEKVDQSRDPDLSSVGRQRAEDLKAALAAFPVQNIFVSEYQRTLQTAEPVATALHLTPVAIAVSGKAQSQANETAAAIRKLASGTTALVVGHSNTIGLIIEALGGPHVGDLCDGEYATIFVLQLTPDAPPRLIRASFGVPDPPQATACHRQMQLR